MENKKPAIYYNSYEIKCPFCNEIFEKQETNKYINDQLSVDIYDWENECHKTEEIVCEACEGVITIEVEAEIADIDYTYYITEKTPPPDEKIIKDVPGQLFLWGDIDPETTKIQLKK
jgi:hypothetical protein